jgi:hypothetical protein
VCFKVRSTDGRWETTFGRFVSTFGPDALAARLSVNTQTVYEWVAGETVPRPERAFRIQSLAEQTGLRLSVSAIYEQRALLTRRIA